MEPSFIGLKDITLRTAFKSPERYRVSTAERFSMTAAGWFAKASFQRFVSATI
jgi:hypothetical protein